MCSCKGVKCVLAVQVSSSDLVLEDSVEGETLLGSGTAGLIQKDAPEREHLRVSTKPSHTTCNTEKIETVRKAKTRPQSSRNRGLSGPITSSLEVNVCLVKTFTCKWRE